jgi:hypothetical protein
VPTKKQRRRRQKSRRHEYEYVYVDEEGNEVEVDETELRAERQERQRARPKAGGDGPRTPAKRAVRTVPPPSWSRVGKRLLIFAPLMYVVFSLTNRGVPVATRLLYTVGYSALFVPFLYWIDRIAYRRYLRQTGQEPPPPPRQRSWLRR